MQDRPRRRRLPGLHIQIGRRYEHADLTQKRPSPRARRTAQLLRRGLDAVQEHYASLDAEMQQALHDAVVRLLRPQVSADWTDDEARRRALDIAQDLMNAPLAES